MRATLSLRATPVRREDEPIRPRRSPMQYALLIYADETLMPAKPPEEMGKMMDGYRAFGERNAESIRGGDALHPTATSTTVRVRDGERMLTDGPFAETREQLGGFYIVEVDSLDEALDLAAKIPGAATGCVEVRPVMQFSSDGQPVEAGSSQAAS